jgi:hypothetical protein
MKQQKGEKEPVEIDGGLSAGKLTRVMEDWEQS